MFAAARGGRRLRLCATRALSTTFDDQNPKNTTYQTQPSFGFGTLDVLNATHAKWEWHMNTKPLGDDVLDSAMLVRSAVDSAECKARRAMV